MFEAIIFDFDGTLVDFVDSDIKSLKHLHAKIRTTVSFEKFLKIAVDEIMNFHDLVEREKIDPLLMHRFRLKRTFENLGIHWDESVVDTYKTELFRTCEPFEGVADVLCKLKKCFKLGLLTNAYDSSEQRERICASGLHQYFDEILVSCEVGFYKPDPKVFLNILSKLDVLPEKAVYIGDSIKHDVRGANSAGVKSVLFSRSSKRVSNNADYQVHGVEELLSLASELCVNCHEIGD